MVKRHDVGRDEFVSCPKELDDAARGAFSAWLNSAGVTYGGATLGYSRPLSKDLGDPKLYAASLKAELAARAASLPLGAEGFADA